MKKHIDNHLNPHSSKGRRNANSAAVLNAANLSNTIAAVASGQADLLASKAAAATNFLSVDNNKNNISPRMTPIVKHELYFPQCYGPPFNQPFPGTPTTGGGTPLIQDSASVVNGTTGSEGGNVNNSGDSSPTGLAVNPSDAR